MMPKVDTFEQDIASEIKRKEASLTEISAASNNVGNDPVELPKKPPIFLIALVAFFVLCLLGFAFLGYIYVSGRPSPASSQEVTTTPVIPKVTSDMHSISPTLSDQIGRFVTHVDKKDQGYIITISDYSSVFAYMTRNETSYIDELVSLFVGVPQFTGTTTKVVQNNATTTNASSSNATSTQKTATTTKATTTPAETPVSPPVTNSAFYDVTISNQNMRVWSKEGKMVVYAFVGNNTLLISNSKEGILALRSGILR